MRVNGKRWGQALVVILVLTGLAANAEQTAQGENTQLQTQKLEADIKQLQIELQQLKTTKEVFDEKARSKLEG
jgi:cell division protein FtsB